MSARDYRERCFDAKPNRCVVCSGTKELVAHHKNGDRSDNRLENLLVMCRSCHTRLHTKVSPSGKLAELQEHLPDSALSFKNTRGCGNGGRSRALMTETDRERIASDPETREEENYRYQAVSRVRDRLDELETDVEILEEHHPDLLEEVREVVCDG